MCHLITFHLSSETAPFTCKEEFTRHSCISTRSCVQVAGVASTPLTARGRERERENVVSCASLTCSLKKVTHTTGETKKSQTQARVRCATCKGSVSGSKRGSSLFLSALDEEVTQRHQRKAHITLSNNTRCYPHEISSLGS